MANKTPNVCQYWVEEPNQCFFWVQDVSKGECKYPPDKDGSVPLRYPDCNCIGTYTQCNKYKAAIEGKTWRCILPDAERTSGKRTPEGGKYWKIEWITSYNKGECDGDGTSVTCSGYSPYHMAFSTIAPDVSVSGTSDIDGIYSVAPSGLDFRLPLSYDVAYARAQLSRCYWWNSSAESFSINSTTGKIGNVSKGCTYSKDESIEKYWTKHYYDEDLDMWVPPCNGAKPECPYYTGVCWEYCVDSKMRQGDKVSAEQILELRYYIYKDHWTDELLNNCFSDPQIKAWSGTPIHTQVSSTTQSVNYIIDTWVVYLKNFSSFNVDAVWTPLTAGTQANNFDGDYPDLVKSIKRLPLKPIICNVFDVVSSESTTISGNIFETGDMNHNTVLIYGDTFWRGTDTYAINLNDPDLFFLPKQQLLKYNSLFEMKNALATTSGTSNAYETFYNTLSSYLDYTMHALSSSMPINSIPNTDAFFINVKTFFGDNNILVFDKNSGVWEYDKISFTKVFVGGIIQQTEFSLTGAGTVDYLPSYQDDFMAYANENGVITFGIHPLISYKTSFSPIAYIYNDAVRTRLPALSTVDPEFDTYIVNYKLYKITFGTNIILSVGNGLQIIGNAGYMVCTLNDLEFKLSNIIKPWEIEGKIYLGYPGGSEDASDTLIEMEIVKKCSEDMPVNQFIIKPKDINEFKSVCSGAYITIDNVYTYEKRSFGDSSDGEYINDEYVGENDVVVDRSGLAILSRENNLFTLTRFGADPLMISVALCGPSGRIVGHIKTKLITWIRQPYCRDVEIYYNWEASYTEYMLEPHIYNYGKLGVTYTVDPDTGQNAVINVQYVPPCGDHDLSYFSSKGAMWYPYSACADVARYNIITQLTENDTSIMEVFTDEDTYGSHGSWDMRMLGPSNYYGYTCDTHASIWLCRFEWSYCNREKIGDDKGSSNIFAGYCRYRGGIDSIAKQDILSEGGLLPKFGNVYRDFLRSYRSIDNIDYFMFYDSDSIYHRHSKWVPANECYTDLDLGTYTYDYPYKTYSSSDYYEDNSYFMHPFGLLLANRTIEGIYIGEQLSIDDETGDVLRYSFDELFYTHSSIAGIQYPYPKNIYYSMVNDELTPIITWYTYKDCPGKDTNYSIQWVWREKWKNIVRESPLVSSAIDTSTYQYKHGHKIATDTKDIDRIPSPYYELYGKVLKGRLLFLDINYPEYKYDYKIGEHVLTIEEGVHYLYFTIDNGNMSLQIDSGPKRYFNMDGTWVYSSLYDTCTTFPWVEDVTLFGTGYNSTDPSSDREIELYDDNGDPYSMYHQRGLNVVIQPDNFKYLPYISELVSDLYKYDINVLINRAPDCTEVDNHSPWASVIVNELYPVKSHYYDLEYCCEDIGNNNKLMMTYYMGDSFDQYLSAITITFKHGKLSSNEKISGVPFIGTLYHLPGIEFEYSNDGVVWTTAYTNDNMYLSTKDSDDAYSLLAHYDLEVDPTKFLSEPTKYLRISFRISPISDEIESYNNLNSYWDFCANIVRIISIKFYSGVLVNTTETLQSYERKYNYSYGNHGDIAPHGNLTNGSLLYVSDYDRSTVYQQDTLEGMIGTSTPSFGDMTSMNKVRGRIMKACHNDGERVDASTVEQFEQEQVNIHDAISIDSGNTSFSLQSFTPPTLASGLNQMGLSYPSWSCAFSNNVVRPLSPMIKRDIYSSCGHKWAFDPSTVKRTHCGPKSTQDTFDYMWINVCTSAKLGNSIDAVVAYYTGTGTILVNPAYFLQGSDAVRSVMLNIYSTINSTKSMSVPSVVLPIN